MAKQRQGIAPLICLVCLLRLGAPCFAGPSAAVAAETTLLQKADEYGQTWCVVKPSTAPEKLDEIIGFCCTQSGVDCRVIQAGGMCYSYSSPPNKVSDASVVMNIYYNLNGKYPFDCYFKGSGLIVAADPSVGNCIYQS